MSKTSKKNDSKKEEKKLRKKQHKLKKEKKEKKHHHEKKRLNPKLEPLHEHDPLHHDITTVTSPTPTPDPSTPATTTPAMIQNDAVQKVVVAPMEQSDANESKQPPQASSSSSTCTNTTTTATAKATTNTSPFEYKQVKITIALQPSSLHNTQQAMHQAMLNLLYKYNNALNGVLLAFDNIIGIQQQQHQQQRSPGSGFTGRILNEMPSIHYNIQTDVLVFNPSPSADDDGNNAHTSKASPNSTSTCTKKRFNAVVNESFPSHIGLVVFDQFNAMVSADSLRVAGFRFDGELNYWIYGHDDDDHGHGHGHGHDDGHGDGDYNGDNGADHNGDKVKKNSVSIGDWMDVTMEKLHECNGLISMECTDPIHVVSS